MPVIFPPEGLTMRGVSRIGVAVAALLGLLSRAGADDGLKSVIVKPYGIIVRAPQAWSLIRWAQDDHAFTLRLPQEPGSAPGEVSCELGVAAEGLEEFRQRNEEAAGAPLTERQVRRTMLSNALAPLDERRFGKKRAEGIGQQLTAVWESLDDRGRKSYEVSTRLISEDTLYTFRLTTDEAHYDAYRQDFEDMLVSAQYSPPETGLQRMPGGFWLQRDYHFALQLPAGWKPAFGPTDRALLFATGLAHRTFTDNVQVLATQPRPLDLDELVKTLPANIAEKDPTAKVTACRIVAQGNRGALELVTRTKRDAVEVIVLERRFRGERRNYEVRFTCSADDYEKLEADLRKALESFHEVADKPAGSIL